VFRPSRRSVACRTVTELTGGQWRSWVSSSFVIVQNLIAGALRRDRGASAVEYGLLAALIAAVIAGVVAALGLKVNQMFTSFLNAF
jgi:pilus assembly protein Flp/PilA